MLFGLEQDVSACGQQYPLELHQLPFGQGALLAHRLM